MAYKVYLITEHTGSFESLDEAKDVAVLLLQTACDMHTQRGELNARPVKAEVYGENLILHGGKPHFIVDIHDGCI